MEKIKMIITDLDGTLLNINSKVEKTTIEYLKKLKEKGYIIVIATGRIIESAMEATEGAEFAKYIIGDNGSRIYDMTNKKDIYKLSISKKVIEKLCGYYNEKIDEMTICNEDGYFKYSNNYEKYSKNLIKIDEIKEFLKNSSDIGHFSITPKDNKYIAPLMKKIEKEIPEIEPFEMRDSFSTQRWIEFHEGKIGKYDAIKKVAELEKIENEKIIAFGDGLNDIDMIKNCGIGVAMGNALEEVKAVSDYTTISHNEEGVKYFLEKYLK